MTGLAYGQGMDAVASSPRPRRVAVIADTDSRWKWGMLTARQLAAGNGIDTYLVEGPAQPSERQWAAVGVDPADVVPVRLGTVAKVLAKRPPDVLVVALPGGGCQAALHAMATGWPSGLRRPIMVAGYVGVVYEKVIEGLLLRGGFDIVLVNSANDARRFRKVFDGVGIDASSVVETTLPFLASRDEPPTRVASDSFTLTFAGQPGVPGSHAHRSYLVDRLIQHAGRHPQRSVQIKLRSVPGERVTHPEPYPYHAILRRAGERLPDNLATVLGDMGEVLSSTDLLVTVSSTAALEAMHRGVPTVLLTDFGIRESLGNAHFVGSGCLGSFDDIDDGFAPLADPGWARDHGVGGTSAAGLVDRVAGLLGRELPPISPYVSQRLSPVYLPRLLASYGLDPRGHDAGGGQHVGPVRRQVRGVIRGTARSLYHSGVTVVGPTLRRLGSL